VKKLVLASSKSGKLREFERSRALGMEVVPQGEPRRERCDEPHGTFVENALAKARHASAAARLPALPTTRVSAWRRSMESPASTRAVCRRAEVGCCAQQKLVKVLADRKPARATTTALSFSCATGGSRAGDRRGNLAGEIVARAPRARTASDTTPHFFLKDFGKTAAELDPEQKISSATAARRCGGSWRN